MTGPRETVRSGYSYLTTDPDLEKSIGFREVDPDRDLGRLHAWLNSDHVLPYWEQDDPLLQVRETINERAQNEDQTLYIGYLDHTPMSYWESYWAARDRIGDYYDADPADQGIHLLIGPREYLDEGTGPRWCGRWSASSSSTRDGAHRHRTGHPERAGHPRVQEMRLRGRTRGRSAGQNWTAHVL